jgi:hypothetical protein
MKNEEKSRLNVNDLIAKVNKGTPSPQSEEDINKFIDENLSSSQAQAVKDILSDSEKTKQILNSDAAKNLFRKFFGGE